MKLSQIITLRLMPTHDESSRAIAFISQQLLAFNKTLDSGAPQVNLLHLRLALDEALLNAIEHGCRQTREPIQVLARFSESLIEVSVEDPGTGFAYESIRLKSGKDLEQTMDFGMRSSKGWGLAIIQSVSREIFWNRTGNRITMIFH